MPTHACRSSRSLAARLRNDEQGMALAFVGISLLALLSVSMLAIDVGLIMTARNQAQNSADSGALAGAVALGFDDFNDRSSSGPAVQNALAGATANQVMGAAVSVQPGDVTFPVDASGGSTLIRVEVHRDTARGNPLNTLIGQYFGLSTADITANATAQASPANAETCVKPWTVPDRWIERQTPAWDIDDTFSLFDNNGNPLANPDIYVTHRAAGLHGYATRSGTAACCCGSRPATATTSRRASTSPSPFPAAPAATTIAGTSPTATPASCTSATGWSSSRAT